MRWLLILLALFILPAEACTSTYYRVWESLGKEKRDLLRDRVEAAREEEVATQEHFRSALERLQTEYGFDGGNLEKTYEAMNADYEKAREHAEQIRTRLKAMSGVAEDLFVEWEREAEGMTSPSLRRKSLARLAETRRSFRETELAMEQVSKTLDPVLVAFQDHVLYLKHNLNAQAIGHLKGLMAGMETDVRRLMGSLQESIQKTDGFLQSIESS